MTRTIKRKKNRSQDEAVYDISNLLKTKFALVLMPTWSLHVYILRYSVSSKVDIVTNLVGSTKRVRNILFKSNKLLTKNYSNEILKIIRTKFLFQQNKINIFWSDERIINKFELELIWCEENGKKWTHIIDTMYFFFYFFLKRCTLELFYHYLNTLRCIFLFLYCVHFYVFGIFLWFQR